MISRKPSSDPDLGESRNWVSRIASLPYSSCSNHEHLWLIMYTDEAICGALYENLSHMTVRANQDELFSTDLVPWGTVRTMEAKLELTYFYILFYILYILFYILYILPSSSNRKRYEDDKQDSASVCGTNPSREIQLSGKSIFAHETSLSGKVMYLAWNCFTGRKHLPRTYFGHPCFKSLEVVGYATILTQCDRNIKIFQERLPVLFAIFEAQALHHLHQLFVFTLMPDLFSIQFDRMDELCQLLHNFRRKH